MALFLNGKQVTTVEDTECSVTLGSSMPSGTSKPTIVRTGSVVILSFGLQLPSGTYATNKVLWEVSPKPKKSTFGTVRWNGDTVNIFVTTDGTLRFNNQQTSNNHWIVGQIVYLA